MSVIENNLIILFALAACTFAVWWGAVILLNKLMGFSIRKIYALIYTDPIAAAILRVGIMATIAYLVSYAFGRNV